MSGESTATWLGAVAAVLDFFFAFIIGGLAIASITADKTEGGFRLKGLPALALFALIILYFWGMERSGGTVFQRLFGIV